MPSTASADRTIAPSGPSLGLVKTFMAMLAGLFGFADAKAHERHSGDTLVGRAAQVGTVIAVVVIGVVALVGILIVAEVEQALPDISGSQLNGSADEVVGGFGDAMGFVPIILIVLLASIVIMAVQRMR